MNYITKYYQRLKSWYANEIELGATEKDLRYYAEPKRLTDEEREQLHSHYHDLRMKMEERARKEQENHIRYWEDKTNDDVN